MGAKVGFHPFLPAFAPKNPLLTHFWTHSSPLTKPHLKPTFSGNKLFPKKGPEAALTQQNSRSESLSLRFCFLPECDGCLLLMDIASIKSSRHGKPAYDNTGARTLSSEAGALLSAVTVRVLALQLCLACEKLGPRKRTQKGKLGKTIPKIHRKSYFFVFSKHFCRILRYFCVSYPVEGQVFPNVWLHQASPPRSFMRRFSSSSL